MGFLVGSGRVLLGGKRACWGQRWITIGIRREEKNRWETRAPLSPSHAKDLMKLSDVKVLAQPCSKRIFTDQEYSAVGVKISEDLQDCDIILGVKEIPPAKIVPGKMHMCFSHTHKGQPAGVPILAAFKEKKATLIDYELLKDGEGRRTLAFGKYAGYAGMINCLHGLGDRLLQLGYRTPFLNIGLAHNYPTLSAAKKAVQLIGKEIESHGLPSDIGVISFVFTGLGNVSQGAQDIFELLPHTKAAPKDFVDAVKKGKPGQLVSTVMDYTDFSKNSTSHFASKFAPYTSVLVNGIYWDASLPRILAKSELEELGERKINQLLCIADISCDIHGGVEATSHATSIDSPFMYYDHKNMKDSTRPSSPQDIMLMTIDNLPAQLPRDASIFFSSTLSSHLKSYIKSKTGVPDIIEKATIVKSGKLTGPFESLRVSSIVLSKKKKNVLILGSGYVSKPAVDYLSKVASVTVASNSLQDATRLVEQVSDAKAVHLEADDNEKLSQLIQNSDVVVSLLPASMHPDVAEVCIAQKKNMITGSYISPALQSLGDKAREAGVTILNEIGLDPGLDHLSAMKMIEEARSQGDKVDSFVSWCGGLPAPEFADNPLGYKFSWRPQGVLLATQNAAKYMMNGKTVGIEGKNLLRSAVPIRIHPAFAFEGIPNRDSLSYIDQYGLQGVQTMFRGTLRYRGFAEMMDAFARIGFLNTSPLSSLLTSKTNWAEVLDVLVPPTGGTTESRYARVLGSPSFITRAQRVIKTLEWLGLFDRSPGFKPRATMLDSFAEVLEAKLRFEPGERDMAFMFHEIKVTSRSGKKGRLTSTLIEYGDPKGYSAMAKTVGLPVAVAAELMMNAGIQQKGVIAPLSKQIYDPMLKTLSQAGIHFKEV